MKTIALFGGSFNPPHDGHFEMARYIHRALKVDEVWFLFSVNSQKDPAQYAPAAHRMEMGRILSRHFPDMPCVMSDIEERLGTHVTHDVLTGLQALYPDHRFVWVMGADNLASFHTWEHSDAIIENFPVAVADRPPYTEQAQKSYTALTYAHLEASSPERLAAQGKGWCFLRNPHIPMSSTHIMAQLRAGHTDFSPSMRDVVDYIRQHRLYGIGNHPATGLQPATPVPGP